MITTFQDLFSPQLNIPFHGSVSFHGKAVSFTGKSGIFLVFQMGKIEKREDNHPEGGLYFRPGRLIWRGWDLQAIESQGIEGGMAQAVLFFWLWEDAY